MAGVIVLVHSRVLYCLGHWFQRPSLAASEQFGEPLRRGRILNRRQQPRFLFRVGEKLTFRVLWSKYSVNAGSLELSAAEQRTFFGQLAWHFRAVAHSMDTIRILYALDDQFDSYSDAVLLNSLQYEMYLHEQGKQENGTWRMTSSGPSDSPNATVAKVPAGHA